MRTRATYWALTLFLSSCVAAGPALAADKFQPAGKWKLILVVQGLDLLLLDVAKDGDGYKAAVVDSFPQLGKVDFKSFASKGGEVTLTFASPGVGEVAFKGSLVADGDDAGGVLGTLRLRGNLFPARLERTDAEKVQPRTPNQKLIAAFQAQDPKDKVRKLEEYVHETPGAAAHEGYFLLLQAAEAGGLSEDQLRKHIDAWLETAKPYGAEWMAQCRIGAMQGLNGKKIYAALALDLAQQAKKAMPADASLPERAALAQALAGAAKLAGKEDLAAKANAEYADLNLEIAQQAKTSLPADAPLEQKVPVAKNLARAAKLAGKADLASDAEAEYTEMSLALAQKVKKELPKNSSLAQQAAVNQKLLRAAKRAGNDGIADEVEAELAAMESKLEEENQKLDEEYHAKVPPFKPEAYAGREDATNDRTVLFELFTGAQCPPCVAADVAFDGLLSTYESTELIALQYHLHIPGPDPLTNADSIGRSQYYSVNSTPSTLFNGAAAAAGGGGMGQSKSKYDEFRREIDKRLADAKSAQIDLHLSRSGDKIQVSATAQSDGTNDGDEKLHLRLALTEEAVRYVGGNQLRFHHHVVRGFPGGIEGEALPDGQGKIELTIDLNDVRNGLDEYLEDSGANFPTLPKLDFKDLAVVAFVQDDSNKRILHAVQASVPEAE
jgi:hypothetical protein